MKFANLKPLEIQYIIITPITCRDTNALIFSY